MEPINPLVSIIFACASFLAGMFIVAAMQSCQ